MRFRWRGLSPLLLVAPLSAQTPQDRTFDSRGVQIRYIEQGSGEPILLIHGYTRSIETGWLEVGVFQDANRTPPR